MTQTAKKYTLTAHDIQAYLCELGIKPTEEVSIYSIEYYFDKLPVTTDKLSVEKLQEQLNTAKKYIEHVIGTIKHDGHLGTIQTYWILPYLEKVLAAIGGDGCPAGPVGKNGLTKEELEWSGDE